MSDLELVRRAGGGDQEAWRTIMRLYEKPLLRSVAKKIGGSDAEDIVQDTFVSLLRSWESFDARIPLSAWLQMVANRRVIEHYRRQGRRREELQGEFPEMTADEDTPDVIAIRGETVQAVRSELAAELSRIERRAGRQKRQAVEQSLNGSGPLAVATACGCTKSQAACWAFESRRHMRASQLLDELATD